MYYYIKIQVFRPNTSSTILINYLQMLTIQQILDDYITYIFVNQYIIGFILRINSNLLLIRGQ